MIFVGYLIKLKFIFIRYTVEWIGREGLDNETHQEYLQNFIMHFYKNITKLVDRAMRKEDSSPQGQIVTEILQHLHACHNSVKVCVSKMCLNVNHLTFNLTLGFLWPRR